MHMMSRKDLNSAELKTVTTPRSPTTVIAANGEVQTNEEATVCQRIGYILDNQTPRGHASSLSLGKRCDEHGYSYEWINGKNHVSLKMVFEYSVIRKTSYQSWFLVYHRVLPQVRLLQHPRHLQRKLIIQIILQQSCQAKVWRDKYGETRMGRITIPQSCQVKVWGGKCGRPVFFRHTGMAARIQRKSRGWQSSWTQRLTRPFFSWTIFRAHANEKWRFG